MVVVPFGVPEGPQPASATKTNVAAARPRRVRKRRAEKNISSTSNAAANAGASTWMETGGKKRGDPGGATRASVVKVRVAFAELPAGGVTDPGDIAQVDFRGWPVQASVTAELKVPREPTVIVDMRFAPFGKVMEVGEAERVKSGATTVTVPVSAMICGLLGSLSTSVSVAVSRVATEGV